MTDRRVIQTLTRTDILVVDQPKLMRGLDYLTCEHQGISLLLAQGFGSERSLRQAFGRVGRGNTDSSRYVLSGVTLVDAERVHRSNINIRRRVEEMDREATRARRELRNNKEFGMAAKKPKNQ